MSALFLAATQSILIRQVSANADPEQSANRLVAASIRKSSIDCFRFNGMACGRDELYGGHKGRGSAVVLSFSECGSCQ